MLRVRSGQSRHMNVLAMFTRPIAQMKSAGIEREKKMYGMSL